MQKILRLVLILAFLMHSVFQPLSAGLSVRIKDIVDFQGVRENQLVGYGLVVGLNGTGDSLGSNPFTKESLISMLERLGVNVRDQTTISAKNIAAVMVTASLPAFARHGTKIDVVASSMGDAKDLRGGTLLVTPLMGADGEVYAVSQGPLNVGGFTAKGGDANKPTSITKGVPTSARIPNGAIIEKEIGFELANLETMNLSLRNPDFTTSNRLAETINKHFGANSAKAIDGATVSLNLKNNPKELVHYLTQIEQLTLTPDQSAKIVIDDHEGIIVMGQNVRVSTVAITHGSITIRVTETPQVSQPNPFTGGASILLTPPQTASAGVATTVVDRTKIKVEEKQGKFATIESGVSLQELVNGLNGLGATPRDLITILQSIKAAGALQADIEVIS